MSQVAHDEWLIDIAPRRLLLDFSALAAHGIHWSRPRRLARDTAPCVMFFDELDSVAQADRILGARKKPGYRRQAYATYIEIEDEIIEN